MGLAKKINMDLLTQQAMTLPYRPPEILLGSQIYSTQSDLWSLGCIIAELMNGRMLFQAETEQEQLSQILGIRGTTQINKMKQLPCYIEYEQRDRVDLKQYLQLDQEYSELIEVVDNLLEIDPLLRRSTSQLLQLPIFSNLDHMKPISLFPQLINTRMNSLYDLLQLIIDQ